jgi:hypothetical protein
MKHHAGETEDVPFFTNDMNDAPATTGKALDPADGPGKADGELGSMELDETLHEQHSAESSIDHVSRPIALF